MSCLKEGFLQGIDVRDWNGKCLKEVTFAKGGVTSFWGHSTFFYSTQHLLIFLLNYYKDVAAYNPGSRTIKPVSCTA